MAKKPNGNYDYDAAAEEARRIEEERKKRMAELEKQIAEYNKEREKYYQARAKTIEAINTLDNVAKSLDESIIFLHNNFIVKGTTPDEGKLGAELGETIEMANYLKNTTLEQIDTNIDTLTKQINSAISELNGLHKWNETLYPTDNPQDTSDTAKVGIYITEYRNIYGYNTTFLNADRYSEFIDKATSTAKKLTDNAYLLVDEIFSTVPSNFTGLEKLKQKQGNITNMALEIAGAYEIINKKYLEIIQIEKIYSSGLSALETNLKDIYISKETKEFISTIAETMVNKELNVSSLTTLVLPNLVRQKTISVEELANITSVLYCSNVINNSDVGNIIYELSRTNLRYASTSSNIKEYQEKLNEAYGYDFEYEEKHHENKNNWYFKIKSEYEYTNDDINIILKPMYDAGIIDADDVREITQPLTIFGKETGSPNVYNNQQYSPHTKDYNIDTANGKFKVTIGNLSYEVTDKDRELIKGIKGYETFFTGDKEYDDAIADVAISDFTTAIVTKEIGSINTAIDEANAVTCVGINRTESAAWTSGDPQNGGLIAQYIRGEGKQYESYNETEEAGYLSYINGNTYQMVETAVTDAMNGTRVTDAISFDVDKTGSVLNKITDGGGNNFGYNTGHERQIDPMTDKIVSYTGKEYNRVVQENEIPGTAILPVNATIQEDSKITDDAYQKITNQAAEVFKKPTTSNTETDTATTTTSTPTDTNTSNSSTNSTNNVPTTSTENITNNETTATDGTNSNSYTTPSNVASNTYENNTTTPNTSSNSGGANYTNKKEPDIKDSNTSSLSEPVNNTSPETTTSNTYENNTTTPNTSSNSGGANYTNKKEPDIKDINTSSSSEPVNNTPPETATSNTYENNATTPNTSSNSGGANYTNKKEPDIKDSNTSSSSEPINNTPPETTTSNTYENNATTPNTSSNSVGANYTNKKEPDIKDSNTSSSSEPVNNTSPETTTSNTYENNANSQQPYSPEETQKSTININTLLDKKAIQKEKTNIDSSSNSVNVSQETGSTTSTPNSETNDDNKKINFFAALLNSSILAGLGFGSKKIHDKKKSK